MAEIHVTIQPIDKSGNGVVCHNPDNATGSNEGISAADSPAPPKSGVQVTAKVAQAFGGPRFANPA